MSRSFGEVLGAARVARAARGAVLAGLIGAGLLLTPTRVHAAEGPQHAATSAKKESPYARYAREHTKLAESKPARVKAAPSNERRAHLRARRRH
jgi:hypothetical protein